MATHGKKKWLRINYKPAQPAAADTAEETSDPDILRKSREKTWMALIRLMSPQRGNCTLLHTCKGFIKECDRLA